MDIRTALLPDSVLSFDPVNSYTIKKEIGRGGSCIVYDAVYKTNAGDEKTVRIKECCPYDLPLERDGSGAIHCSAAAAEHFTASKAQMYEDFRLCNRLFYADSVSDSIINTINIYEANNTVYVVSAWSKEQVLTTRLPETLRDCVSIVRQTAFVIRSIHQAGYLYLDIKPDNISVINGTSKRVHLFDFDSLIPVSELRNRINQRLSYTKGFAALELRRGQFSKLGFHTDIYGIGALLFYLLFGRTPEAPDCIAGAVFDFSKLLYTQNYPDQLFALLKTFFRKTLAGFSPDRWQNMDEVIRSLETIEKLSDPIYPFLNSTPLNPPAYFIGRSAELETIEEWYHDDTQQNLFISGMGGIGKSTFVRHFLAKHRTEWDSIAFLYFRGNLRQTIINDADLRINGTERLAEEKEADYFERKLRKLREIIIRDRVLLVIDNFENRHDPDLNRISELNCRKIFISRKPMGSLNLLTLKLDAIQDEEDQLRLFVHYLDREAAPEEIPVIRDIIELLGGNTLAIELFARQISNSFITLGEAYALLRKHGVLHSTSERVDYLHDNRISYEQLEAIITRLFETESLSGNQISALKALTLFPAPGIEVHEFMRLAGLSDSELLAQLIRFGWIARDHERIYLHPLIRDVIRNLPGSKGNLAGANTVLSTLYTEITLESHREEINKETIIGTVTSQDCPQQPDLYTIITDHEKLNHFVTAARGVIDAITNDSQLAGSLPAQKLCQSMVVNLPKHEDEAILNYGRHLIDHPQHLSPLDILEVVEPVEKVLLSHQEYDEAIRLMESAEQYAVDERTKAEFCGLISNIYDYRDAPGDPEEMLSWLQAGIDHARLAPKAEHKHLLAEYLLGKLNTFTRIGIEDDKGIEGLIRELMDIIEKECLPYSEIRQGFAIAMGFYWAELGKDQQRMEEWIAIARAIGEKLCPAGLDFIDNCIIPPAIMYLDLGDYVSSESTLQEGVRICDQYPDLIAYIRKRHDLHRCLLDVYLYAENYAKSKELLALLDDTAQQFNFPDNVDPVARDFLTNYYSEQYPD